jgi:hypothetical protein
VVAIVGHGKQRLSYANFAGECPVQGTRMHSIVFSHVIVLSTNLACTLLTTYCASYVKAALAHRLTQSTISCSASLICVLTTGGLGKSTLANKVYTDMKSMTVFGDSKYVTFDLESESNDNAMIGEVQRWLSRQSGPVLLVLDNAQRQHQVDSIINDANIREKSFVLITSRRRDLVTPSDLYSMPSMEDDHALKLFRWHSQRSGTAGVIKTRTLKVRIS